MAGAFACGASPKSADVAPKRIPPDRRRNQHCKVGFWRGPDWLLKSRRGILRPGLACHAAGSAERAGPAARGRRIFSCRTEACFRLRLGAGHHLRRRLRLGPGAPDQSAPHARPPAAANAVTELVVTAQKREQRLQDVPVVVTVLTDTEAARQQRQSVSDLVTLTPGLTSTTNGTEGTTIARIRGVGNVADNPGLEDAVGLYIDGVYRPRNGVSFNDLGELDRHRDPEGPAGHPVRQEHHRRGDPDHHQAAVASPSAPRARRTVQNYGGYGGSVSVTGPIVGDKLAIRLYVADRQRDGFVAVVQRPARHIPNQNDEHVFTTRDQLLVNPTEQFRRQCHRRLQQAATTTAASRSTTRTASPARPCRTRCSRARPQSGEPAEQHRLSQPLAPRTVIDEGVSAEAHWTTPWLGNARLTSITAYRDNKEKVGGDTDATLADILISDPSDQLHPLPAVLRGVAVRRPSTTAWTGRWASSLARGARHRHFAETARRLDPTSC